MVDASLSQPRQWALVLAAGDGSRSVLAAAPARARSRVAPERVCASVAQRHHGWWSSVEGPILIQDAQAQVPLLPSGDDVAQETVLQRSLAAAMDHVVRCPELPVLLGLHPDEPAKEGRYARW